MKIEIDYGALGDRINFLEIDLIDALEKETDGETKDRLTEAIINIATALNIVRSIGIGELS